MRIAQSTYPEVGDYLKRSRGIIIPTGSTEQHSPQGVMGTDHIDAETIAWRMGEIADTMVGPTLTVGISEHHMTFPGSITLKPSTYIAFMRDYILSLLSHGFERFYILNGHGANTATLNAAFAEIYIEIRQRDPVADIRVKTAKWFENDVCEARAIELTGHTALGHASSAEVSVAQFADAANIRRVELTPDFAPLDHTFYNSVDFRRRFPDGRIESNPIDASPEIGGKLVETAAEYHADQFRAFMAD